MQAGSWMGDEPGEKERPRGGLFNKVRPSTPHRENRAMGRRNMGEAPTVQPLGNDGHPAAKLGHGPLRWARD